MKARWRPFIQQLQQTLSNFATKRLALSPPSNQLWLEARAASRVWEPVQTPEQEESYQDDSWTNSKPQGDVQVHLLSAPPHISDLDTVAEMPVVNKIMSHIYDEPAKFASISGPLLATQVKDTRIITRIPTTELQGTRHITGSLRRVNDTDAHLLSTRTTPNHEFAIVPRQRSTAQLPPRLGDDTADAPEHVTPVETLINAKIAEFHVNEQRLPHAIKVSFIRYAQNWMNTRNYKHFNYKGVPIPITGAAIGEFAVDEVRLD